MSDGLDVAVMERLEDGEERNQGLKVDFQTLRVFEGFLEVFAAKFT